MVEQEMSDDEALRRIAEVMAGNAPTPEDKQSVHTFLHNVAIARDTTKLGYLRDDKEINELGTPRNPIRTYKGMALIASMIMGNDYFEDYFEKEAEILTATSLSRDAKLIELAILQRREIADVTKRKITPNKGWFKKKGSQESEQATS